MANSNFICRYCSHHSTITGPDKYISWNRIDINEPVDGPLGFNVHAITCPNPDCKKITLSVFLTDAVNSPSTGWVWKPMKYHREWKLLPESEARALPSHIPLSIQQDYYEACRIINLSPKASATLSRRCLQGMIRDFFNISLSRLKDEIDAIEDKIDPNVFKAINAVRSVGNIGAHMERDINMIIDVEPNEARLLIELIEQLVEDWYVSRKEKQDRLSKIIKLAEVKSDEKKK